MSQEPLSNTNDDKASVLVVSIIIFAIIAAAAWWLLTDNNDDASPIPVVTPVTLEPEPTVEVEPIAEVVIDEPAPIINELPETSVVEVTPEPVKPVLPPLNESDNFISNKLPDITWRKELLKLLVTDDMVRRFVVFTDNFSQGTLAYEHSVFVAPNQGFYAQQGIDGQWLWDESSVQRFSSYVDLLRTIDSQELVAMYFEMKPLIDEAYQELGYPDEEFTDVLQNAITRVLDMEFPKQAPTLTRPSVMYKYQNEAFENLDDADKLLLRIGRENLLVIKSILLEINDKLSRVNN